MKEIIDWLIEVEDSAYKAYKKAASHFSDDREFSDFLNHLSKEEDEHCNFLYEAKKILESNPDYPSHISLDNDTKNEIKTLLKSLGESMDKDELTKERLIDYIISIEYSELNYILLYAIGKLKGISKRYYDVVKSIQHHKAYIEDFIERQPESDEWLKRIRQLPRVGDQKVLIVDDDKMVAELIGGILKNECIAEVASNGEDALQKINDEHYAAIISDVNMPVMNGIEFYSKVVERYPDIKNSFLFFTTSTEPEHLSFFEKNGLSYLIKPSPINVLRKAIIDILIR
jgi:CheY-like chemotaxis protein